MFILKDYLEKILRSSDGLLLNNEIYSCMKDFVLVDHEPFTKRRRELFYIQELKDSGINIQVWDISQYCYPSISIVDTIDTETYVIKVFSLDQLENLIRNTNTANTAFFLEFFREWRNRKILKLFSNHLYYTVRMDLFANTMLRTTFKQRILMILSKPILPTVKNRFKSLLFECYKKYYHIQREKCYLSSSSIVLRTGKINHPDYEKYRFLAHKRLIEGDYIVFCDIYFPLHPDYKYFDGFNFSDGTEYHQTMCRFFDYMEDQYKMPVVIAAHPKADYEGGEFGARQIIKYQTDNLVYYATSVVMHNCNSVSYSILANKPIAFISTDEYEAVPDITFYSLKLLASTLGKEVYNLDKDDLSLVQPSNIREDIRRKYIYSYLTSQETENKRNTSIICSLLST